MIAFDIDGCLNYIKEDIIRMGREYFKTYDVRFHEDGYYLREIYAGAPQEAYDMFWKLYGYEIYTNPPQEGACEVIQYLKSYEIPACFITTRNVSMHFNDIRFDAITDDWLKKYDIGLPVYYRKDKDVAAQEKGVKLMIEDKPANILRLQKVTKVLIFDHPYNNAMDGIHVKDWKTIKKYIDIFIWNEL